MNEWIKSIVGYLLIVNLTMQILPNQKYEQYVKIFTGFLLLLLVLQPVLKIRSADFYLEEKISEFVKEQERLEEQIGKAGETLKEESMEYEIKENWRVEIPKIPEVMIGE